MCGYGVLGGGFGSLVLGLCLVLLIVGSLDVEWVDSALGAKAQETPYKSRRAVVVVDATGGLERVLQLLGRSVNQTLYTCLDAFCR